MKNRAGKYRTNFSGEAEYMSFVPAPLPPDPAIEIDSDMIKMLVRSNNSIASLESIAKTIPNMELFISMYVRKEALMSSQIEGTQATLEDVFDPMITYNTNRNVADVVNYVKATEYAIKRLNSLPLCNRLIKEAHAVLMDGVRGQEKSPGEFRHSQNWIGGNGSTLKNARYIPPHQDDMIEAMSDLEKYMNEDDILDALIRAALIHYQFETIHPFLDGNGRVGRLLITLYLVSKGILKRPILYLSDFFERNRSLYYDNLTRIRTHNDLNQWLKFFLIGVIETAKKGVTTFDAILQLQHSVDTEIKKLGSNRYKDASKLIDFMYQNPVVDAQKIANVIEKSYKTTYSLIAELEKIGILKEATGASRGKIYKFNDYIDLFKK